MTKKDYLLLASVIKKEAEQWTAGSKHSFAISAIAVRLCDALKQENSRFDPVKFMKACEPE